ncbi:MAG: leucine-rich repeat domain-containing protein [Kiritimatiellia bacterium]
MKRCIILSMSIFSLLFCGCFKHKEAPHRPVTAQSLQEAVELKDSVERIEMTDSEVGDLPGDLASMPRLSVLLFRGAKLGDLSVLPSLEQLVTLDISRTGQKDIPVEVCSVTGLTQLYLADNKIETLSGRISSISSLEYLNLDRNQLVSLPEEIGNCVKLRWLRLNDNRLTVLPESIQKLTQLQRIYLANNKFKSVPEALQHLPVLEDIDMSGNPVKVFPDWLTELPEIRQLNFDGCQISELPEDLSCMSGIEILSLGRCPVSSGEKERIREALPRAHIAF